MEEALSQDEVDALLKEMNEGGVALGEEPIGGNPTPYDLVGEERSVSRQFPGLEIVHDRLVRQVRQSLSAMLGSSVGVDIKSAELLRYARFRNRLEPGSPLSLFSIAPEHGNGLVAIGPAFLFQVVDRIFGGQGKPLVTVEEREYSAIELQVVARLVAILLSDLQEAWSTVSPLECAYLRTEMNAAVVSIAAAEDMVLCLSLHCDLGGGSGNILIALPVGILEPVRATATEKQAAPAASRVWLDSLSQAIHGAQVDVSVELGSLDLSAGDLLQLESGHLLDLSTRADDPVAICVEGEPVLSGIAGTNRGQHAVRVLASPQRS